MTVLDQIRSQLKPNLLVAGDAVGRFGCDGFRPEAVIRPRSEADAVAAVRAAAAAGAQVVIRGSGTKLLRYPLPRRPAVVLATEHLNQIVEYAPRDMTVTAEAGMRLADLNDHLAREGQRLPLDPPYTGAATIGGVLSSNESGPIRFGHGTARDSVIGMRMVLGDGRAVKSGGKVVKNVAGYDLHKLFIGSAGTLGLITVATFKLRPLPEARRLVVLRPSDWSTAMDWITRIASGPTRPAILDLLNPAVVEKHVDYDGSAAIALIVGFEGTRAAVDWQCDQLQAEFFGHAAAYDDDASASLYERVREWPAEPAGAAFKATMKPSHVGRFADEVSRRGWALLARAGDGIVHAAADELPLANQLDELRVLAQEGEGSLTITRAPTPPADYGWQHNPDADFIMRRIKDRFDPRRVFGDGPHVVGV